MKRVTRTQLRAATIALFWLSYAVLPLLVTLRPVDPMACCRGDGAHRCFMRARGAEGAPVVAADAEACAMAKGKAVATPEALPAAPLSFDHEIAATRLGRVASRIARARAVIGSASRAPPPA